MKEIVWYKSGKKLSELSLLDNGYTKQIIYDNSGAEKYSRIWKGDSSGGDYTIVKNGQEFKGSYMAANIQNLGKEIDDYINQNKK